MKARCHVSRRNYSLHANRTRHSPKYKRSKLIKLLSNLIPEGQTQRIYLPVGLIGDPMLTYYSGSNENSEDDKDVSEMWNCPTSVTLADIPWLAEDRGDPNIKTRAQLLLDGIQVGKKLAPKLEPRPVTPIEFNNTSIISFSQPNAVSTPVHKSKDNSFFTPDPQAMHRIGELENELEKLRMQIASIVAVQERGTEPGHLQHPGSPSISAPPPPPLPAPGAPGGCAPPPPPPGPPPPLPSLSTPKQSIQEIIRKNKGKSGPLLVPEKKQNDLPNMTDVLKGLGTVKLRSIARSPGGTPIREKPKPSENDPASLIAQALKRKFSNCVSDSPESDKENAGSFSPSPRPKRFNMGNTPPGPHMLKPSVRRLRNSRNFPLKTLNS